jgi:hypothetical protein
MRNATDARRLRRSTQRDRYAIALARAAVDAVRPAAAADRR